MLLREKVVKYKQSIKPAPIDSWKLIRRIEIGGSYRIRTYDHRIKRMDATVGV